MREEGVRGEEVVSGSSSLVARDSLLVGGDGRVRFLIDYHCGHIGYKESAA